MKIRRDVIDLFLISALGLFIELVFIRWLASELRIVAFYKNFTLISAFLGLGLGFNYRRRTTSKPLFELYYFPILAASVFLALIMGRTQLSEMILLNRVNAQTFVWAGALDYQNPLITTFLDISFFTLLFLLFLLTTILFIPLGEFTARKFANFPPILGYTINVIGSLVGILFYTLVSFLGFPPYIWFLIGALVGLYFLIGFGKKQLILTQVAFASLPVLLTLFWPNGAIRTLWSPYYRIDLRSKFAPNDSKVLLGYELSVNQAWHQRLWNLDPAFVSQNYATAPEHFDTMQAEYDVPYRVAPSLEKVLIVGAGTGNDVAGALRAGAEHVVAVEIDPIIFRIGQELHPEGPYNDPRRVEMKVEDARSFFRHDTGKYDLIVFGLLDSHTLFSTANSIRLDNFVYTEESLTDVQGLLNDGGLLAISFGVPPANQWVGQRIYRTLTDVFGNPPQVYEFLNQDILFLISTEPLHEPLLHDSRVRVRTDYVYRKDLQPATDDWPYLYLQKPTLPSNYWIGLAGVILISLFMVTRAFPNLRQFNHHFFFMGAAFFLLETKSITEMALLFGSTWIVNAVVIAGILVMIVISNLIVLYYKISNPNPWYIALFASLLVNFFIPVSNYLGMQLFWRIGLATIIQVSPLFFAGMIFATTFSKTSSIESALGSNLLGSVLGGVLEYTSLTYGIRSLYLLAFALYVISMFVLNSSRFTQKQVEDVVASH